MCNPVPAAAKNRIIKLSVKTDPVSEHQLRDHYNPQILQEGTGIQAEIPVLRTSIMKNHRE